MDRGALVWILLLLAVFAVVTGQAWARGIDVKCGCFSLESWGLGLKLGEQGRSIEAFIESVRFACVRSLVLLVVALYLFVAMETEPSSRA